MSWASKPAKKRCHTNIGVEKEEGEMVLETTINSMFNGKKGAIC
jgi:hypothetical protein